MKLRSPESFWLLKNGILKSYPSLKENVVCDIAVIGSGITGALISHTLHNAGFKTIVIDKRDVATGSTSASTAMLQYEIDTPMKELASMIGEIPAVECYKASVRSIELLDKLVKSEKLKCGFELKKSLQVAHSKKAETELKEEFELRRKHGFNVEWLTSREIRKRYKMISFAGILSEEGASFDSFQFAHELIENNHRKGMPVFDHTVVKKVEYNRENVVIRTDDDYMIVCRKIIFCSGFETLYMFRKKYAEIVSTFVCASEQQINCHPELKDVLIRDTDNPYTYMRTTDDKRLLIGGEDVKFKYGGLSDKFKDEKANKLIRKVKNHFPNINFTEDYNWSGAIGLTKDGLPYIGKHPDFKNAIFVLALGGNGSTFSVQGMELMLKILAGEADPLLQYYRFDR